MKDLLSYLRNDNSMPLCKSCNTYFVIPPCPRCNKPTSRKVNATDIKKIKFKGIWLTSNTDELDFIWAQVCEETVLRVRTNNTMLRQGYFNVNFNSKREIKFEFIGSTFNQTFLNVLERLYPGIESIFIVCDIVGQSFSLPPLKELLDDILLVNRNRIKNLFIIWLKPYINIQDQYSNFQNDVINTIKEYLISKSLSIEVIDIELPMYSSQEFSEKLKDILASITEITELHEHLNFPLRPLFRTYQPILDPNVSNRVMILDIESSSLLNSKKSIKSSNLNDVIENIKCLACNSDLNRIEYKCLTCKRYFCRKCLQYLLKSKEEFCLGSIYHGLHRFSLLK